MSRVRYRPTKINAQNIVRANRFPKGVKIFILICFIMFVCTNVQQKKYKNTMKC